MRPSTSRLEAAIAAIVPSGRGQTDRGPSEQTRGPLILPALSPVQALVSNSCNTGGWRLRRGRVGNRQIDLHIGLRLRQRRMVMGITQAELAKAMGLTFQQIQKYESGANQVVSSRLYELASALGVPVSFFLEGLARSERSGVRQPSGPEPAGNRRGATACLVLLEDRPDQRAQACPRPNPIPVRRALIPDSDAPGAPARERCSWSEGTIGGHRFRVQKRGNAGKLRRPTSGASVKMTRKS